MRTAMCLAFVMAAAAGSAQAAGATPPAGPAEPAWPSPDWPAAAPAEVGLDAALLHQARDYALEGDGSGIILRHGRAVLRWGDPRALYDLKSSTKGIGVTALGLAMADGKVRSLDQPARTFHPTFGVPPEGNAATGWPERITLLHLATQTAGFAKPGGYTELLFQPGTKWSYSDGGPNWLAECLTLAYKKDVADLLFERVFEPIGIRRSDLVWRRNSYRPHEIDGLPRREFGSGISANVEAMSRIGYLYLRGGRWRDRQLLPREFVEMVRVVPEFVRGLPVLAPEQYGQASNHYGLLWWNNADGTLPDVPRDAYWTWGLYDSLTVVMPSLDLVIARAGKSLKRAAGGEHYGVLRPFLGAICRAATATAAAGPPCPPSPVIKQMAWAPPETIVRAARGSDNWPLTWGDDDALYGAYGDGRGFDPPVPQKLSMGLVRITGGPADFRGENIRSPTFEQTGDGPRGRKASGMLMAGGVLYAAVRNAGNSVLAASRDRGLSWTWADWKFAAGFGCPTFLNFGRNYAGARDEYVYLYSHDSDSAYEPADRMVLARAPKGDLLRREAWEFFAGFDSGGRPSWSRDAARRAAVFSSPGRCYRSGVSYAAPLRRYLWVQVLPGGDTRYAGGLAVFDAPEPWGPWTTACWAEKWDAGPGETASLPPRWMSPDGRTVHLVFSGDDAFCVRRATLTVAGP